MQITIETITPEIAASMLATNRNNRSINIKHVRFLTAQIQSGYFMLTGDTIKISKEGFLIDGQHRLTAIVNSNIAVPCAIARNVDREAFEVIDTGKNRAASDVLAISGYNHGNNRAAIARNVITHRSGNDVKMAKGSASSDANRDAVSNKKILDFVENNDLDAYIDFGRIANSKSRLLSLTEYATYCFLFSEKSPSEAVEFLTKVSSGAGLKEGDPALILRRVLERNLTSTAKITGRVKKYYIIRAWNAYRERVSMTKMQYDPSYKIPEIK